MLTDANGCVWLNWDGCEDAYYLHNLCIRLWMLALSALTCTPHNIVPLCSDNASKCKTADAKTKNNLKILGFKGTVFRRETLKASPTPRQKPHFSKVKGMPRHELCFSGKQAN